MRRCANWWKTKAAERQAAFDALAAALEKLPQGLAFADDAARDEYVARLWQALAVEGQPLKEHMHCLEELAAARLQVFETAGECSESVDKSADELRFTDGGLQHTF